MTHTLQTYGLALLFLLVLLESAGLPLPGETALIAAAILASRGHFSIVAVIAVTAAAAIVGDNGGYYVGRRWGRKILGQWEWLARLHARAQSLARRGGAGAALAAPLALLSRAGVLLNRAVERGAVRLIPPSERFFERHGPKTVFIGRFVAILRFTAAWMAGVAGMQWWKFFFWNATGGIAWATLVGLVAYYSGQAAADAINRYGLYGAAVVIGGGILLLGGYHLLKRRAVEKPRIDPE
jgi:membrane protein DedA with SNARE-associated domain